MSEPISEIERKIRRLEDPDCNGHSIYLRTPIAVGKFVGGTVRNLWVIRTAEWKDSLPDAKIREMVERVWAGKFSDAACQIDWAEGALWSAEVTWEFADGKRGILFTDGSHVVLKDHDGKGWFLRLLPAA